MDRKTAWLLSDGYKLARLHNPAEVDPQRMVPEDCIFVTDGQGETTEFVVTSTRLCAIALGDPNGYLGDDFGWVVGDDIRLTERHGKMNPSNFTFTKGGGRLEPYTHLFRTEVDDAASESVVDCLLREVKAEIGLDLDPDGVVLIAVRQITEQFSDDKKRIGGRVCVDAYFAYIVPERLGPFHADDGEVGERRVLSTDDLLCRRSADGKNPLPDTQKLALAATVTVMLDIFEDGLPKPILSMLQGARSSAVDEVMHNRWKDNLVRVIHQHH